MRMKSGSRGEVCGRGRKFGVARVQIRKLQMRTTLVQISLTLTMFRKKI